MSKRAANDGDTDAPTEVARFYYYGIGTRKDFRKAVEWYKKAAGDDPEAQFALGRAYELGEGVEPDSRGRQIYGTRKPRHKDTKKLKKRFWICTEVRQK